MKKYYSIFITLILSLSIPIVNATSLEEKVKHATSDYLANNFLNATFMFADHEKVLLSGAKGVYSLNGKQLAVNQKMPIASGTKPISAAGILRLQDQKRLNVQDSVAKILGKNSNIWKDGKVPVWANKVTLHHLLTHTSGLAEYFFAMKIDPKMPHDEINKEIANFAATQKLAFTPGTRYKYTNTNFVLLGLIIEKVSGKTLSQFFEQEFFTPLGMTSTHLASLEEALQMQNDPNQHTYPVRYFLLPTGEKPKFIEAKVDFVMVPYADGGVVSTTKDLVTWHRALHQGKILSDKTYTLMTKKHFAVEDGRTNRKTHTGYGIFISELTDGDYMYYHAGSAVAIRSESGYIPAKNFYYAIISNVAPHIPEEMKDKIDLDKKENQLDIFFFREAIIKAIGE